MTGNGALIRRFEELGREDIAEVGGKNASLGELVNKLAGHGIPVPTGFATTAEAYRLFVDANGLTEPIAAQLAELDSQHGNLGRIGAAIRDLILAGSMPDELERQLLAAYRALAPARRGRPAAVAVRSSATAEDLPEASFAGQLESYLNIRGERELVDACLRCYASLFTDRAIVYRENHGFGHLDVALSIGVQSMVRSDKGAAGVMFSIDPETGFPRSVLINAAWGLGELVVQGSVDPDEYQVFKPLLDQPERMPVIEKSLGAKASKLVYGRGADKPTRLVRTRARDRRRFVLDDEEIIELARWARAIERHYGQPMDMEWAKDGVTGEMFVVQARPETVQSRRESGRLHSFALKEPGRRLCAGHAIGDAIAVGRARRLDSPQQIDELATGEVLVTSATDPDWVPIMKKAAAIVTDHGGRTSHAAIVSRELGLTAIVGCEDATATIDDGQELTVSCAEGDTGFVYAGRLEFERREISIDEIPQTATQVMVNMANPAAAFRWWQLPADGIGLARMEFIIGNLIRIHPLALVNFDRVRRRSERRRIKALTAGYERREDFFVETLARGMARIAAVYHPKPVIVRLSDFKSNEYAELIGGRDFEPKEANPMIGWRGASRYYSERYRQGFALECRAVRMARERIGLDNICIMIPFCRSPKEADRVLEVLAEEGLERNREGLRILVMAEIPANILLAEQFAARFDGFSIGSNDLTQLTLGVDRDSELLSELFDERNEAVMDSIASLLQKSQAAGSKTGLCGQAPSDYPEFAEFLVAHGIDSISVSPDSFVAVKRHVAAAESLRSKGEGGIVS